jgi:hypothetical protein
MLNELRSCGCSYFIEDSIALGLTWSAVLVLRQVCGVHVPLPLSSWGPMQTSAGKYDFGSEYASEKRK